MRREPILPLQIAGAVWGHLVGDAMGVPYEFRSPEDVGEVRWGEAGTHDQPPGTWSDDGSLMLALLDSLVTTGEFDPQDQGRRALAWWRAGAYTPDGDGPFDIGNATRGALGAIERETPAEQAGAAHERSASNGSLMRILPLALWAHARGHDAREAAHLATRASSVTHRHPVCLAACAVYTLVALAMLDGAEPPAALEHAIATLRQRPGLGSEALDRALEELVAWPATHRPEGRGGALNAFWSAWEALTASSSYAETIERAIRFGHDTDTTAAIAGGLAGIRWGLESEHGIPQAWLAGMRGAEIVEPLIDRLLEPRGWRTSTAKPIRVDWVDLSDAPALRDASGRVGMTFLPGKRYDSTWSGPWWRHLERDVARLRNEFGTDVFVLLVEDYELAATRTTTLPEVLAHHRIELVRHPVVDMDIPADRAAYRRLIADAFAAVRAGRTVVFACRGGLGRTGTAVACLLVDAGLEPEAAIERTRASRRKTIERGSQVAWVTGWGDHSAG